MTFKEFCAQHAGRLKLREIAGLAGVSREEAREAMRDPDVRRAYEAARARYIDGLVRRLERGAAQGNLRAVRQLLMFARGLERRPGTRRPAKTQTAQVPASLREWPRKVILPRAR